MVAWSLKCNIWSYIFLDFHEPGDNLKKSISHAQHTIFLYQQNAHFILYILTPKNFNYKNFIGLQRSIGKKKRCNLEFQKFIKFIKKKLDHKKNIPVIELQLLVSSISRFL